MRIIFEEKPVEGKEFHFDLVEVAGTARSRIYLDGKLMQEDGCDDPPCHEVFDLPTDIAGQTLLIEAEDSEGKETLTFFIDDDGEGVQVREQVAFA